MASTTPGRQAVGQTTARNDSSAGSGRMSVCHAESLRLAAGQPRTLAEVLVRAARVGPEDAIGYHRSGGACQTQSFSTLLERAQRIHAGLQARDVKPRDIVLLQLSDARDVIETFWGCVLGGFRPLIMSVPPSYRQANGVLDKLLAVHEFLERPLVIAPRAAAEEVSAALFAKSTAGVAEVESLADHAAAPAHHVAGPNDTALLNLTSGSTGRPKCIMLSHDNLLSRARGTNWLCDHRAQDRVFNWLPFDHIGSISDWHIRCVVLPCRMVYAQTNDVLAAPLQWLELIDQYRITHSWAPNFAYALVRDAVGEHTQRPWDLSCVRCLLTAGEAVTSDVVHGFLDALKPCGLGGGVMRPAFGMAELGSGVTYATPTDGESIKTHTIAPAALGQRVRRVEQDDPAAKTFADLGPVIPGMSMRIVDEHDEPLPVDIIGRLQVKGSAVFAGYLNDPQTNAEVFTPDGWFHTGDVGFLSDGRLVLTGREKETIIINGANFHNHELEAVVQRVPGVDVSYTAACAVRRSAESSEAVAIFFHPADADESAWPGLQQAIRTSLVRSMGVNPPYIVPVGREDIPKTSIGKIQRAPLARRFENGDFDALLDRLQKAAIARRSNGDAPTDERQQTIVRVWQAVLGLERIGSHDSFFDLGGQSLHLAQVRSKLLDEYQIDVSLITLLAHPTVSALAEHLGSQGDTGPTFEQHRDRSRTRKASAGRRRARRLSARTATAPRRNGA